MITVLEGLEGLNAPEKVTYGGTIKTCMTGNANFPDSAAVMANLNTRTGNLKTATDAADSAAVKIAEPLFDLAVKGMVLHIQGVLIGVPSIDVQKAMVTSSGFHWETKSSIHIHDLEATPGVLPQSAHVRSKAYSVVRHVAYVFLISEDNVTFTFCKASTLAAINVLGLTSGKRYWFKVAVVVGETMLEFSDATDILIN